MSEHPFVAMLRRSAESDSEPRHTFPQWEAQLATLREIKAAVDCGNRFFERGDIVRYIGQTGPMKKQGPDGLCLMFWRMLDPDALDDRTRIQIVDGNVLAQIDEIDCLLMVFDGVNTAFLVSSTALLERDPRQDTVR